MSETGDFLAGTVVGVAVALVVVIGLGRRLRRRWLAGTGYEDWQSVARRLPWRDRVRLERANTRGRAAAPRLAGLAVRRARVMAAVMERLQHRPLTRRLRSALLVLGLLEVALNVVTALAGKALWVTWMNLALGIWLTGIAAALPRQRRRQLSRLRRSAELNEALARSSATGAR